MPLRTQQAWIGAAAAAIAIGAMLPTSANNNRSLAVRRCMMVTVLEAYQLRDEECNQRLRRY
jgi:hypothetical protein